MIYSPELRFKPYLSLFPSGTLFPQIIFPESMSAPSPVLGMGSALYRDIGFRRAYRNAMGGESAPRDLPMLGV